MAWMLLICLVFGDLPSVQVETLKSGASTGVLKGVTRTTLDLDSKSIPISDVLEVRFSVTAPPSQTVNPVEVQCEDGTRLQGSQLTASSNEIVLSGGQTGQVKIPKSALKSARLVAGDPKLSEAWQKLLERESKKDLLVVKKGDKLDFVPGVAGDIDDKTVKFLVDDEVVPVNRDRVYGVIFQPAASTIKPQVIVELVDGTSVNARQIVTSGDQFQISLISGANVTVPVSQVQSLDFSLGKVKQLSAMVPLDVKYVPMFGDTNEVVLLLIQFRKNMGPLSSPISLGGQTFPRGICIHSRTTLKYRIGGEYRRFQATMGIDDQADDSGLLGDVHFRVTGDGKVLFEGDVKGSDAPRPLDLDVSGVRDLELLVDFGGDLDIADWLSLADAKILK